MKLLGVSGSIRAASTNTALLRELALQAPEGVEFSILQGLDQLPVFNADLEGDATPPAVLRFCENISSATGLVISSPEYVRSIPGGL